MVWPALIAGGAALAGTLLTNKASAKEADRANQFTEEQLKNRHQWEVDDLRKAGLNPVLSAGAAPSIGGSAKAEVQDIGEAVNSAMAAKKLSAELKNIQANTEKLQSEKRGVDLDNVRRGYEATKSSFLEDIVDSVIGVSNSAQGAARATGRFATKSVKKHIGDTHRILKEAGQNYTLDLGTLHKGGSWSGKPYWKKEK